MPYARKRRTTNRKLRAPARRYRRKATDSSSSRHLTTLYTGLNTAFPERFHCRIKFSEQITVGGNPVVELLYRANSIFDPRYAVGGGDPRFYSALAAVYNDYQVQGCRIQSNYQNVSASSAWLMTTQGDGALTFTTDDLMEFPGSKKVIVNYGNNFGSNKTIKEYVHCWKCIDNTKMQYMINSEATGAAFGANPTEVAMHLIHIASIDGTNVSGFCRITMEFDVICYNRKV